VSADTGLKRNGHVKDVSDHTLQGAMRRMRETHTPSVSPAMIVGGEGLPSWIRKKPQRKWQSVLLHLV